MKKKAVLSLGAICLIAACLFIPKIQTFAISAMSFFRVNDAKTIEITMADIETLSNFPYEFDEELAMEWERKYLADTDYDLTSQLYPDMRVLNDIRDFDDFKIRLPKVLDGEYPSIACTESHSIDVTVNAGMVNDYFKIMGLPEVVDPKFDGAKIKVDVPAAIAATYEDVVLYATQGVYVEEGADAVDDIWSGVAQMPFLSENLRKQLRDIDLKNRDIYLPVIMGFGRKVSLGGQTTGYVYTANDLMQAFYTYADLPEEDVVAEAEDGEDADGEASALIWTKGGVAYCLTGEKSDAELIKIARSMR